VGSRAAIEVEVTGTELGLPKRWPRCSLDRARRIEGRVCTGISTAISTGITTGICTGISTGIATGITTGVGGWGFGSATVSAPDIP